MDSESHAPLKLADADGGGLRKVERRRSVLASRGGKQVRSIVIKSTFLQELIESIATKDNTDRFTV